MVQTLVFDRPVVETRVSDSDSESEAENMERHEVSSFHHRPFSFGDTSCPLVHRYDYTAVMRPGKVQKQSREEVGNTG